MLNLEILKMAFTPRRPSPNDGVGLARLEFIITKHPASSHGAHFQFEKVVRSEGERGESKSSQRVTDNKGDCFVDKLAQGVPKSGAAFYPNDVIVPDERFQEQRIRQPLGGSYFEPQEENPHDRMAWALRIMTTSTGMAFVLECKAMKKGGRNGLTNVKTDASFVVPWKREKSPSEIMKKNGLGHPGEGWAGDLHDVQIPSNVTSVEEFGKVFDGFSIGSNDLLPVDLGLDPGIPPRWHTSLMRETRRSWISCGSPSPRPTRWARKSGSGGQAPSDYPEFARFLVECDRQYIAEFRYGHQNDPLIPGNRKGAGYNLTSR